MVKNLFGVAVFLATAAATAVVVHKYAPMGPSPFSSSSSAPKPTREASGPITLDNPPDLEETEIQPNAAPAEGG